MCAKDGRRVRLNLSFRFISDSHWDTVKLLAENEDRGGVRRALKGESPHATEEMTSRKLPNCRAAFEQG